jgi:hypothetical protein
MRYSTPDIEYEKGDPILLLNSRPNMLATPLTNANL